jgi:hypothetical protein
MQTTAPSYFEMYAICKEGDRKVVYRIYVELAEWEKRLWEQPNPGGIKMMALRAGISDILQKRNLRPVDVPATGHVIDHGFGLYENHDKPVQSEDGHKVWVIREG